MSSKFVKSEFETCFWLPNFSKGNSEFLNMLPLPFTLSAAGWETGMVRGDAVLCGKSNSWYRESVVRTIHFCLAEITTELTLLDVEATDKEIPQGQTIADIAGWKGGCKRMADSGRSVFCKHVYLGVFFSCRSVTDWEQRGNRPREVRVCGHQLPRRALLVSRQLIRAR